MAGKKKKKDKKKSSQSLSHIGSHLVPSAIFAAAPRSASPSSSLSSTWPRRSPVSQAIGSAGNVGWAFVGDMNRTYSADSEQTHPANRPPADLPSLESYVEESAYETVDNGDNYDKTTKFARNTDNGEGPSGIQHTYHVLEDKKVKEEKPEPVYAKVDINKKRSSRLAQQQDKHLYDEVEADSIDISSDDDLTDVTSNDEDSSSTVPVKRSSRHSQKDKKSKSLKVRRQNNDESASEQQSQHGGNGTLSETHHEENYDSEHRKKTRRSLHLSTKKHNSIDTVDGVHDQEHSDNVIHGKMSPTESPHSITLESHKRKGSKKSSLKRRAQVAPEEDMDSFGNTSIGVDKERQLERVGFEGTSQKVELSDISEDEEGVSLRAYPVSDNQLPHKLLVSENIQMSENESIVEGVPYPNSLFDELPVGEELNELPRHHIQEAQLAQQQLKLETQLQQFDSPNDLHNSNKLSSRNSENEDNSAFVFNEQKKQLDDLIKQQEYIYKQQAQQQKEQQIQATQLAQQQIELQKKLQQLEELQTEKLNNLSSSPVNQDFRMPKDMLEQQEHFLRLQQRQQARYESQQERVLNQQQKICDQIKELEYQQKELQSNLSMLSPKEVDLAEIRWQEKEIIRLLNEQQLHQQKYDRLHKLQQNQLEQQALKFQQEKKTLETQQETLQIKIQEQEEKSKKLEIELQSISSSKPLKKARQHDLMAESEDDCIVPIHSHANEVDAMPFSRTESQRSDKKSKTPIKPSSSLDKLTLENSRLSDLNVSLQKENQVLRQFTESVERSTGGEALITQQYIKDLQQDNKVLQDTVHRLNVELSRYQMKYRQATVEEVDSLIFPKGTGPYPWLVNTKFLAPLFVAYDDRLKERDDIIKVYHEEMNAFKERLMEIVKENQDLHMRLAKSKPDALVLDEWQQLQEQAKLVVEENSILMKQQDLQQKKIKEMHQMHGQDVSKLSIRITKLESEKKTLEVELEDSRLNYSTLLQKYETLISQEDKKIPIEEHIVIMDECRSIMEDMKENKKSETDEMESKLEAIKQEKQNLASSITDSKAQISQLSKEIDIYRKTQRKLERKNLFLEKKLEHILEREVTAQQTLDEVLKIAEKTAEERDSFEEMAKTQKLKQKKSRSLLEQGDLSIIGLQEKLKSNKKKSSEKMALITGKLNEKEKEVNKIKAEHEKEINRLRELVREKQKFVEEIMGERRMFDQQLDKVWKKADLETQQMKKSVEKESAHM